MSHGHTWMQCDNTYVSVADYGIFVILRLSIGYDNNIQIIILTLLTTQIKDVK